MSEMFRCCKSLKVLDLSSFNTNNVNDMQYIFGYCESLEKIYLSSFSNSLLTRLSNMFAGIPKTCEIKSRNIFIIEEFNSSTGRNCCNCCLF